MSSQRFQVSAGLFGWAIVLLVVGAALLVTGWWVRPLVDAQQAAAEGRLPQALEGYREAERRIAAVPLGRKLMPSLYDRVVADELAAMYGLKQYDEVIDKAGVAGTPGANFWAGCAIFVKADLEILTNDKRIKLFSQAQQEFRRAMENAPGDYDAKYNFELTGRLISGLQKEPETVKPKSLNMLRPSETQAIKKIG